MKNKVMLSVKMQLRERGPPCGRDARASALQCVITGGLTSCLSLSGQRGLSSPHSSPPADSIFFPHVSRVGGLSLPHFPVALAPFLTDSGRFPLPRSPGGPFVALLVSCPTPPRKWGGALSTRGALQGLCLASNLKSLPLPWGWEAVGKGVFGLLCELAEPQVSDL